MNAQKRVVAAGKFSRTSTVIEMETNVKCPSCDHPLIIRVKNGRTTEVCKKPDGCGYSCLRT